MVNDVLAAIREAIDKVKAIPPIRTEPIKLTPLQWGLLKFSIPKALDQHHLYTGNLIPFFGVPVVLVERREDSTPVVEGWVSE